MRPLGFLIALIVLAASAAFAAAQCPAQFLYTPGANGFDAAVFSLASWDPDGAGPAPEQLYAGGRFTKAGGAAALAIARWDGSAWNPLGSGIATTDTINPAAINALAVYNGNLYAAGRFTSAGGVNANSIARWDGSAWHALGTGLLSTSNTLGTAYSLTVLDNSLVVGGSFLTAGGVSALSVARWNGTTWSAMSSGINGTVQALCVHNGTLFAAGSFTTAGGSPASCIAQWSGSTWLAVGSGVSGGSSTLYALASSPEGLYVGGAFTLAGGAPANCIARWDGSAWYALPPGPTVNSIHALCYSGGELFVHGGFSTSTTGTSLVYSWNGAQWSATTGLSSGANAFTTYQGRVILGGNFVSTSSVTCNRIAQWSGTDWQAFGNGFAWQFDGQSATSLSIVGFATYNNDLIATGNFDTVGGVPAWGVTRWDGLNWSPLGSGIGNTTSASGEGDCAQQFGADLYVGGNFNSAGGITSPRLARWDGQAWHAVGSGANGKVRVMATYNGSLFAGGDFTQIAGVFATGIVRFDGAAWTTTGAGIPNNGFSNVQAMTLYNGELIVAGAFPTMNDVTVNNITRWDGSTWRPLGSGLNSSVSSLAVYNGLLYAAGQFSTAGGVPAQRIARWNGAAWEAVGAGPDQYILSMTVANNQLFAAGTFTTMNGIPADSIARYSSDGAWSPLTSGTKTLSYPLFSIHDELISGRVSDRGPSSLYCIFGRWSDAPTPWLAIQPPATTNIPCSTTACLAAAPASGYSASTQWELQDQGNWSPITNGPISINGATVANASGVQSPQLCLTPSAASSFSVRAVVSSTCATTSSTPAIITITPCCGSADFNCDGDVGTDQDIDAFFACLSGLCPSPPCPNSADFNADGDVGTDADIDAFFRVLAGGTC